MKEPTECEKLLYKFKSMLSEILLLEYGIEPKQTNKYIFNGFKT